MKKREPKGKIAKHRPFLGPPKERRKQHWFQESRNPRNTCPILRKAGHPVRDDEIADIQPKIEIFCDADWKSLSTSTMEAEYVAMDNAVEEAIWLRGKESH
ncbi:hypothetical protein KM043_018222 [Ampulex compressa]|nr:hypothetical protein KM043_018222 [Ampulex compressa]